MAEAKRPLTFFKKLILYYIFFDWRWCILMYMHFISDFLVPNWHNFHRSTIEGSNLFTTIYHSFVHYGLKTRSLGLNTLGTKPPLTHQHFRTGFLAHLSRRQYTYGMASVLSHFQRYSSPKPLSRSKPNFMWSLLGYGKRKFVHVIWVT